MKKMTLWGRDEQDDRLVLEVIRGEKTATCTPKVWYYDSPEEPPTEVGDLVAVYDQQGKNRCTILITENYEIPFGDVDERIAKAENAISVEEFRKDHLVSWEEALRQEGIELNDHTIIVVEHFELVEIVT
ncbi:MULTISPECIES: ASCH domain-containing protein [unclassified Sutcliffiella]|uniref:ASCH domain-containing protein n=1 Tax=unclassified Sutcliffiella TaxID=2837532 RepID=UPI0030CAD8CF